MPVAGNFGVSANYTFADGHDQDGHVLRGATKHTANLGGFFENDQFSARLNYSYRSDTFIGLDRNSEYSQKGGGVVSASVGYKFNGNFSLNLDALNLNNPTLKYFALNDSQPRGIYTNGRQYYLTARVKF
jgi:iron complex outermembrane recepter protein